ncbi:UNVERIFIED_CONTAM: hypothetical protein FKN15_072610 [Acipenser sinensis]
MQHSVESPVKTDSFAQPGRPGRGRQPIDIRLSVMAVTRRGGRVGVRTSLLSEWLRGGSWGDCRPYKLTFCCSLSSAHLKRKRRAEALEKKLREQKPQNKRKPDRENSASGENLGQTPSTADMEPGLQREASPDLKHTKSTSTKSTAPAPEHPVRKRVVWEILFRDCNPFVLSLAIPIAG